VKKSAFGLFFCLIVSMNVLAGERNLVTQVNWTSSCSDERRNDGPHEKSLLGAALVATLAPKIISGVVDIAATAISKAGERKELARSNTSSVDQPYSISKFGDLSLDSEFLCLRVLRGELEKDQTELDLRRPEKLLFYFEAEIKELTPEPYFRLEPRRLIVRNFEESSFWSSDRREYTIALSLSNVGSDKPFASTIFTFENVEHSDKGYDALSSMLLNKASLPMLMPPVADYVKAAQAKQEAYAAPFVFASSLINNPTLPEKITIPDAQIDPTVTASIDSLCQKIEGYNKKYPKSPITDSLCSNDVRIERGNVDKAIAKSTRSPENIKWANTICTIKEDQKDGSVSCKPTGNAPVKVGARFGHMITEVTLVETRPESGFGKFVGETVKAAAPDIDKALQQQLIPSQRKAAEDAANEAARTAHQGTLLADLNVTKSEQALNELQLASAPPSEQTDARVALLKAKIAANSAYRTANLPVPYPELET